MNWKKRERELLGAAAEARRACELLCWGVRSANLGGFGPRRPPTHRHNLKIWSLGVDEDGNMWRMRRRLSFNTGRSCSFTWGRATEQVRSQAGPGGQYRPSLLLQRIISHASLPTCSALCCCDVSGSHCLVRCTLAGVAAKSTSLATEHRVA